MDVIGDFYFPVTTKIIVIKWITINCQGWQVWRELAGGDQPDQPALLQDLLRSAKGWAADRSLHNHSRYTENVASLNLLLLLLLLLFSYKTFSDLPRGEELIDHFTINHTTWKMLLLQICCCYWWIRAGDQKCKSMRKLAGRTLIDILPPKVWPFMIYRYIPQKFSQQNCLNSDHVSVSSSRST